MSTCTENVQEVMDLLLWARSERIVVTHITVGEVSIGVQDLKLLHSTDDKPLDGPARRSLYEQYGGDALADVAGELHQGIEPTVEDDDE